MRTSLLSERYGLASASEIAGFKPQLEEWVQILIDELADEIPGMKEMPEKKRTNMGRSLTRAISVELIGLTSGMSYSSQHKSKKDAEEKSHQEWDKKRKRRGSGVSYWGEYGSF